MTRLGLNLSEYVNGVTKRHADVSRTMFPGYRVHAVTNGVHPFTWVAESLRKLYDQYVQTVFEARSDVAIAVARLIVIEAQVDATEKAVSSQSELVATYNKVVKQGSGNVLVYYQAFNELAQSRVQLIQLQRDFIDEWIALETAVGQRLPLSIDEPILAPLPVPAGPEIGVKRNDTPIP